MSTLEKLLVLGVLILVGVILAISLFWNRPDANGYGLDTGTYRDVNSDRLPGDGPVGPNGTGLPNQSTLTPGENGVGGVKIGGATQPGEPISLTANQTMEGPNAAPYPFLQPSLNPDYWSYRVRQGDTPMILSERISGSREFARIISRSNEDKPLVPGTTVFIPKEIVKAPSEFAGGDDALTNMGSSVPGASGPGNGVILTGPKSTGEKETPATVKLAAGETLGAKSTVAASPSSFYTVKRGDSLRKIAREQLKSEKRWREIKTVNNLKSDTVREGQKLQLP